MTSDQNFVDQGSVGCWPTLKNLNTCSKIADNRPSTPLLPFGVINVFKKKTQNLFPDEFSLLVITLHVLSIFTVWVHLNVSISKENRIL